MHTAEHSLAWAKDMAARCNKVEVQCALQNAEGVAVDSINVTQPGPESCSNRRSSQSAFSELSAEAVRLRGSWACCYTTTLIIRG